MLWSENHSASRQLKFTVILAGLFYFTACFLWSYRPRGKWKLKSQSSCLGGHSRPKSILSLQWETTGHQWAGWHHCWVILSRDRRWKWHRVGMVKVRNSSGMWRRKTTRKKKGTTHSPALCIWPHCVPVPAHVPSHAQQTDTVDPIFLLALAEWTEKTMLPHRLCNAEVISVVQLAPSWLKLSERGNAARLRGQEGKERGRHCS